MCHTHTSSLGYFTFDLVADIDSDTPLYIGLTDKVRSQQTEDKMAGGLGWLLELVGKSTASRNMDYIQQFMAF